MLTFLLERLLGVLYTKGCNSGVGLLLVVYLSFEALCRVGGLFFTFQRRPPVAIYLLGCLIAVCYVVKLERVLCRTCRWEGVKRWDAFRLGALFDLFLVSGHLLGVLLGFSLFLGSLFLWCCFLPFILLPLSFVEERWDCCGLEFGKDEKQCVFPGWPP